MPDPTTVLRGEGFQLRPWRPDDLESLLHANDAEVSRGLRDRFPYPYTRGMARPSSPAACWLPAP